MFRQGHVRCVLIVLTSIVLSGCPQWFGWVTVPDVTGMSLDAAGNALQNAGLVLGETQEQPSDTVPNGTVISQNPVSGETVKKGAAVSLVVSTGPAQTLVPDCSLLFQGQAETALLNAGLTVGVITEEVNPAIAPGRVIRQSPEAGTNVAPGSPVDLVISAVLQAVAVPNLLNMTLEDAEDAVIAAGLTVGAVTEELNATVPKGLICDQDPEAGSMHIQGTPVELHVSLYLGTVATPNLLGSTQAEAQTLLTAAQLLVGTVTEQYDETAPAGTVIAQDPEAGTVLDIPSAVTLVLSKGPAPIPVPNLAGLTQAQAEAAIVDAGFTVGRVSGLHSVSSPVGVVLRQQPEAAAWAVPGAAIVLAVSLGAAPDPDTPSTVLFDNSNDQATTPSPSAAVTITLAHPTRVTSITTWHEPEPVSEGEGEGEGTGKSLDKSSETPPPLPDAAPSIALEAEDGFVYGPWLVQTALEGEMERWNASEAILLPAGSYTVVDSRPDSWLSNAAANNAGFTRVEGQPFSGLEVNSDGGLYEADGLRITAPEGVTLSGLNISIGPASGEGATGPVYYLDGLPETLTEDLTLELPLDVEPDGDIWVRLYQPSFVSGTQCTAEGGPLVQAEVDGSLARITLPAYDLATSGGSQKAVVRSMAGLSVATGFTSALSSGGRFRLVYPVDYQGDNAMTQRREALGALFEMALDTLIDNTDMTFRNRTVWPLDVGIGTTVVPISPGVYGYAIQGVFSRNSDYIVLNRPYFESQADTNVWRSTIIHELFHLMQYNYVPIGFTNGNQAGEGGWLYDATATAVEWLFCGATHWPTTLNQSPALFPLNGLLRARSTYVSGDSGPNADSHGYAAGLFFHHFFATQGMDYGFLARFWTRLAQNQSVVNAFFYAANRSFYVPWTEFSQQLYGGSLAAWNPILRATTLSNIVNTEYPYFARWETTDVDDALVGTSFRHESPPLSAFVHTIALNCDMDALAEWHTDNIVRIRVEGLGTGMQANIWSATSPSTTTLLGELPPDGQNFDITLSELAYPPNNYGKLFITLSNADDSLQAPTVTTYVRCRFGNYPTVEEVATPARAVSIGVNGTFTNHGIPNQAWAPTVAPTPGNIPLVWNGSRFTMSGTYSRHEETNPQNYSDISVIYQLDGELHPSGAYVSAVQGSSKASSDGVETDEFGKSHTTHWEENTTINLVMLPYFGPIENYMMRYDVNGAQSGPAIVGVTQTFSSTRDGETVDQYSRNLGTFDTIENARVDFYWTP